MGRFSIDWGYVSRLRAFSDSRRDDMAEGSTIYNF